MRIEVRPSYELVDYSLRPAKSIVRKMILETLRRLSPFGAVRNYKYVGFGSTYFSDFIAFHRALGISNMVSIERETGDSPRFHFNRPFACIKIQEGLSTDVLPTLDWTPRTVLWLDYDDPLNGTALADVGFFCARCALGGLLVVTLNARPLVNQETLERGTAENALEDLAQRITRDKVPAGLRPTDLIGWKTAEVYHRIIRSQIREALDARNGVVEPGAKVLYRQLFNFRYADGAKMLTTGGIFYDEGQQHTLANCDFDNLTFIREGDEACTVDVPVLTLKERRHLDTQLPGDGKQALDCPGIPTQDLEKYREIYAYFPSFVETEY